MDNRMNPLQTIVHQLLAPLPGDAPAGRWMRYEPVFMETAKLREEDDPNLPMGEWERPLVKADWRKVAEASAQLLARDTKDFQIAGWLVDAWIRTAHMEGLCAGIALIAGLSRAFWENAWPAIDDGDSDRRVAPFVWMNTNLPLTLKSHVVLLPTALHRSLPITLLDWERASTADDARSVDGGPPSRRDIRSSVKPADGDGLRHLVQQADTALAELDGLTRLLDERLQQASPSLSKLSAAIDAIRVAAQSLLQEIPAPVVAAPPQDASAAGGMPGMPGMPGVAEGGVAALGAAAAGAAPTGATSDGTASNPAPGASIASGTPVASAGGPSSADQGNGTSTTISDRAEAYAALTALADYLQTIEPHSPTPYLIRRAVQLGQLSLPQMVKEVSASAGSLDKFFELLGIAPPN